MMKKLALALLLFLPAFNLTAFCQADNVGLKDDISKLHAFYSTHIVEKAFLHFDRPGYMAGDTIYFKAYITLGEQHQLSTQSGVLYVDLISPQNIIEQSIKLQLQNGLAWGDFALPDTLRAGNYRVRAYTKLMANQIGTCFFSQVIPVGSAINSAYPNTKSSAANNKPDLQFFPEGGQLITGVETKMGFKAIGPDGLGMAVKGVIVDNTGKTTGDFASAHLGIGALNFTPEEGKTYKANVTFGDGSHGSVDIPAATNGIVLAIDNSDTTILTLGIRCSSAFFNQNKGKTLGLVMNSGVAVSNATIRLNDQLLAVDLRKSQFRTGTVQFTLFSPTGVPLSERLVFIRHNDILKLNVSTNQPAYKTREKVSVSLNAKNSTGSLVPGHFSVAVTDEAKLPANVNEENTIFSWLWLSSDLRGYIEQPSYYFENPSAETQANLDLLMLTQGYRRFTWSDLLAGKYPTISDQPEKGLAIRGMLSSPQGKPVANGKINLFCLDGGPMLSQVTDSAGKFDFSDLSLSKGSHYILKEASGKNKNRLTYIADSAQPLAPVMDQLPAPPAPAAIATLSPRSDQPQPGMLKVVSPGTKTISKRGNPPSGDDNSFRAYMGPADQVVGREALKGSGKLSSHLDGLLNGIIFKSASPGEDLAPYLVTPISFGGEAHTGNPPMLVIIDGVSQPRGGGIDDITLDDIESVEVYKNSGSSVLGAQGGGGVMCIYTIKRANNQIGAETASGTLNVTIKGFYDAREFYSPKYDHPADNHKDLRTTIYWNPELSIDKDRNASFDFYNADGTGTYRIVVEGMDENGNLAQQVYRYKVE